MAKQTARDDIEPDPVRSQDRGIPLNSALGVDRQSFMDAWGDIFQASVRQPMAVWNAGNRFARQCMDIARDASTLAPEPTDKRFADPAWTESPVYRRVGQAYVAWTHALDDWLAESHLEGMPRERARYVLDAAKDIFAPVNVLPGNPEALRAARDSQGRSLVNGIKNFVDDLQHNHGYPACADRDAFKVGQDVAATEGAVIYRSELLELIQYQPATDKVLGEPLLYVFSQVNRFYLGDLTPDRSLFKRLLEAGVPVFAISWRNPKAEHRNWNLDSYADGIIAAIGVTRKVSGADQVNLMGLCAGGLAAAAAAGALQARGDQSINSLSLFVNVLDNRVEDSDFGLFVSERSVQAQKQMTRARGLFEEKSVFEMFALLRFEENIMGFMRSNYLKGEDPLKHPLLFWSIDYTRLPAGLHADFLDLSLENKLAKRELQVLGQAADLSKIDYPVYLMAGSTDHITPWKACYRSTQLFGQDKLRFVLTNQNHTQTISSRDDNPHLKYWIGTEHPQDPEAWQETVTEHPGSWVANWIEWLKDNARNDWVAAPRQYGGENFPELDPAPGRYVLES